MDLVYFALLCSVLIFVHELGHFVFAKVFGVKVLTFSIGFGPRLLRIRGRETEYCIALLPLGGFVKMLEETRQDSVLPEDRPRTFEAQPIIKRAIIVLAGPAMNILFPVLLYFGVLLGEESSAPPTIGFVAPGHPADGKLLPGDRVLAVDGAPVYTFEELRRLIQKSPNRELTISVFRGKERVEVTIVPQELRVDKPLDIVETIGEIGIGPSQPAAVIGVSKTDSPAFRAGLRTFDVVIEVRGKAIKRFTELEAALAENRGETIPVAYLRPVRVHSALGSLGEVSVYESGVAALTPDVGLGTVSQRTGIESADLYVWDVPEGSAEHKAELRPGDRITAVDGVEVSAWITFEERLFADRDKPHSITFERQGVKKSGVIQLRREVFVDEYGAERTRYVLRSRNWAPVVPETPVESRRAVSNALIGALEETYEVARFIFVGVARIVEGKVSLSTLGGPLTVYDVVGEESRKGASYFIWAMAVISINLGLINLLPIPVLDGGHLLFFLFEGILRRPLPLRVREIASLFGLIFLIAMMGIAFKNDLERRWDVIESQVRELVD
ncbi:MAG: RIP metalloprotease RseP [Polyangiaceae bacterium]|nr:RIP metalloprotease RseP [Polyangiaceae bacterium]MBK8937476.1 RIP metalloprotease RseP [Polyangiaceae bacterium]